MRELKPTVVHFAGHGGGSLAEVATTETTNGRDVVAPIVPGNAQAGLYFHSAAGGVQVVSAEAIARTFGSVSTRVQLVVLNACYSAPIAEALQWHVDCVVGMTGAIHDKAARSFAIGLSGGLGEHESIAAAFAQGEATGSSGPQRHRAGSFRAQVRERVAVRRRQTGFDRPSRACAPICLPPLATASEASGHRSTETS